MKKNKIETTQSNSLNLVALDSGLVLKAIHLPREHGQSQEVTLEQLQVFQVLREHKNITLNRIGTVGTEILTLKNEYVSKNE